MLNILDLIMPDDCLGCGTRGELLCNACAKKILAPRKKLRKRLKAEASLLDAAYAVGWREGALKKLVERYKFSGARRASKTLAGLLDAALPEISGEVIIVPLPTISRHIRERGFDHTLRLAKDLAKRRGWKVEPALIRLNKTVQVGADEAMRKKQADQAYGLATGFQACPEATYLLLDDVWTTGASMQSAARVMRRGNVTNLIGTVIERGR